MNFINKSNEENAAQEAFYGNDFQENLTLKQKVERFIANIADKYDALMERYLFVRMICCYTALSSTIAFIILLVSPNSSGWIGFFELIGLVSALLACPLRLLKVVAGLIIGGFTIGLAFFGIGCLIGAAIGAAIGLAFILYAPAIVTIPYCRNELMR